MKKPTEPLMIDGIISDPSRDRQGDVIPLEAVEPNYAFLGQHGIITFGLNGDPVARITSVGTLDRREAKKLGLRVDKQGAAYMQAEVQPLPPAGEPAREALQAVYRAIAGGRRFGLALNGRLQRKNADGTIAVVSIQSVALVAPHLAANPHCQTGPVQPEMVRVAQRAIEARLKPTSGNVADDGGAETP